MRYLHSDIETVERTEIIRDLRLGEFDVLVGINLLREGLDMPEVSLVAIFDADKEGFLRSEGSLIQTIGRAARNVRGKAILYADRVTGSMQRAIDETDRRRAKQIEYNRRARHRAADRSARPCRTSWKARATLAARAARRAWRARAAGGYGRGRAADARSGRRADSTAREEDVPARSRSGVRASREDPRRDQRPPARRARLPQRATESA